MGRYPIVRVDIGGTTKSVMLHLRTERLQLVAATLELAQADRAGPRRLAQLLGAHEPTSWPPPLNGPDSQRWTVEFLTAHPAAVGWATWYFLHREHGELRVVGIGGFGGEPSEGTVEIGYAIVPESHRFGFAPEAVRALVAWAFTHHEVERVIAHTLPTLVPSIRVLEKCGFRLVGKGEEEGTVRYEVGRGKGVGSSASSGG